MDLSYAPELPPTLLRRVEEHARALGLPLAQIELLGQDPRVASRFALHAARGGHHAFLASVDWPALERRLDQRARAASWPNRSGVVA